MSRSNPNLKNPATRFFKWSGGEEGGGKITYYDKDQEKEIEVKTPFSFLVLDELSTVSGFLKTEKSSYWSNEIKNISKDELVVKTKSGVKARGKWNDIKGDIPGAKYAQSVYIAFRDETNEFAIGNIKIMGGALSPWIEFKKKFDVDQIAIIMDVNPTVQKNGSTKYYVPTYEGREVSAETDNEAKKLDAELQAYLGAYLSRPPEAESKYASSTEELDEQPATDVEIEDVEVKDGKTVSVEPAAEKPAGPAKTVDDDETIPLKDIPF